jgi:hypothetical protein
MDQRYDLTLMVPATTQHGQSLWHHRFIIAN